MRKKRRKNSPKNLKRKVIVTAIVINGRKVTREVIHTRNEEQVTAMKKIQNLKRIERRKDIVIIKLKCDFQM